MKINVNDLNHILYIDLFFKKKKKIHIMYYI